MRVAIDTSSLRPPVTGIGHFVRQLANAMLPLLAADEELLSFNGWRVEPLNSEFLARAARRDAAADAKELTPTSRRAAVKAYDVVSRSQAARKAVRALRAGFFRLAEPRFDIFHAANYVAPGNPHKPVLPVIYDLSHLRFPQAHPAERVEWLERRLKSLAAMPHVQTVSQFSKREIVSLLGVTANRISVTYPAPDVYFRPEPDADEARLAKFDVQPFAYLLAVGRREPRKNFKTVAEAYAALPASMRARCPLLWVGPSGWGDIALSPAVERARQAGRIRIVGYVPARDLAALYRNTLLFVMPSLYEGFGMPVVEAMACGASIALSRIPVLEEIAARYARYVDPMDVDGWRRAIAEAVGEGPQGRGRDAPPDLTRFSWPASAATTLQLYRRLGGIERS
ncbi:MAG TPA: glycosyltransferase family 1 protein [Xanthobacteraceae bacterium]|nr:glycosyltransferase family 1 protein [Xanthobacteraceae bacterium]